MIWGHKISKRGEQPTEVTRAQYNASFGVATKEQPEIPEAGYYAWEMWWRLNARRPTGDSQTPISWAEMQAFCVITNMLLNANDIIMIEAIDNAYLIAISEERRGAFDRSREESNQKPKAK